MEYEVKMWTNTVLGVYDVIKSCEVKILKVNKYRIYYCNDVCMTHCEIINCSDYDIYVKIYNILYMGKLK